MMSIAVIEPHEIVYMHTIRLSDGALVRKMAWHEPGPWGQPVLHTASLNTEDAIEWGLDIAAGSILCQPWAMVYAIVEMALTEKLGLL
jgi:hypothetical protein